ncbi:hypothetical protein K438DRAFT_2029721 [Mycena galopus ATCC 62051]|nr:hypothetical protein K438DRAFT_2029721 [Mycena galopus ATCC 62051]
MSIFSALRRDPQLKDLSLTHLFTFIRLLSVIKNDIVLCQPTSIATDTVPLSLPPVVHEFISNAADVPFDSVPKLWPFLKDEVWALRHGTLSERRTTLQSARMAFGHNLFDSLSANTSLPKP